MRMRSVRNIPVVTPFYRGIKTLFYVFFPGTVGTVVTYSLGAEDHIPKNSAALETINRYISS